MTAYYSRSFLKNIKVIKMELPFNQGDNAPTRNYMLLSITPIPGYILLGN